MAWLPALTAATPRERMGGARSSMTDRAPRGLKLPARWKSSSLRKTAVPGPTARSRAPSCQRRTGVTTTRSPRRARVARIASRVGSSTLFPGSLAEQALAGKGLRAPLRADREGQRLAPPGAVEAHPPVLAHPAHDAD